MGLRVGRSSRLTSIQLEEIGQLKQAIDANDFERVKTLMTRNPTLHRAPLGLWQERAAHLGCRMPRAVGATESGETGHCEVDDRERFRRAPGRRRATDAGRTQRQRIPMMELLVSYGADVNAEWNGNFPIIFAPCEAVDPIPLKWLLDHGAESKLRQRKRAGDGAGLPDRIVLAFATSSPLHRTSFSTLVVSPDTTCLACWTLLRGRLDRICGAP